MSKQIFYWITTLILLIAIYGAGNLSLNDYKQIITCPKFLGIPVCYFVLLFFVLATVNHFIKGNIAILFFYLWIAIPGILALFASIKEIKIPHTCPYTTSGIPMCYLSLLICISLIIFKYLSTRTY